MNQQQLYFLLHGKTEHEIAEGVVHAPARKAILDAAAKGVSPDILEAAWDEHIQRCKRRGLPVSGL